jgi:hypothetical protein
MPKITRTKTPTSRSSNSGDLDVWDRLQDIEFSDEGIKMALYGNSGTGKTTLWATFPGKILALICSGGKRPGELRSINTPEYKGKVKQLVVNKSSEIREITSRLGSTEGHMGFNTLVLDHASGFQDLVLKEILGLEEVPVAKTWGLASQQQYGQATVQCKEYWRGMLDLPINVVIVAHERIFKDESDNEIFKPTVGASLMPQLAGWLHSSCDYVCQTYIRHKEVIRKKTIKKGGKLITKERKVVIPGEVEYCLRTKPDATYASKFRVPKGSPLLPVITDPSYDKIHKMINGLD